MRGEALVKHSAALGRSVAARHEGHGPSPVRDLLIVEDHPLMGEALSLILKIEFGLRKVHTEPGLQRTLEALRGGLRADAILLDLGLPDCGGVEGIVALRRQAPGVPIIVITAETSTGMVAAALAAGARGYVSKALGRDQLCEQLHRAFSGESVTPEGFDPASVAPTEMERQAKVAERFASLTPQQMRILRLICAGMANKEISYTLSITEATVKTHVNAIMSKINVRRRTQAARLANEARLFDFADLG